MDALVGAEPWQTALSARPKFGREIGPENRLVFRFPLHVDGQVALYRFLTAF
jgi:hypothetical protein